MDPEACAAAIAARAPSAVINAAAWTGVDAAETEEAAARAVNAAAPGAMARACAERAIPFLHVSTDYVFDGSGEAPFSEEDPTGPLGAYGRTKLEGERLVAGAMEGLPHAVLRTSWVVSAAWLELREDDAAPVGEPGRPEGGGRPSRRPDPRGGHRGDAARARGAPCARAGRAVGDLPLRRRPGRLLGRVRPRDLRDGRARGGRRRDPPPRNIPRPPRGRPTLAWMARNSCASMP